ncbi:DUF418 domain-containing protein [Heyndrickxia sp. NPDC080065]|uniref:DUF418 domain-containing protein n=1 Tax=Heyndrickxia sp. NPDC080065 TaxID=3390568 RepID=UPI003D00E9DE
MDDQLYPTQLNERISSLDVLRGFSLLGIFLINMMSFQSPILYYDPHQWWKDADQSLFEWIQIFVQASFYPIFAMMFGYGLVLLREKTIRKGMIYNKIVSKRLLTLLVIGIIHAFFIWSGDILINYALFGFLLIPMLKWSGKVLMAAGLAIFFIPNMLFSLLLMITAIISGQDVSTFSDINSVTKSIETYATGSYWDITIQRFIDWYMVNGTENIVFLLISIIPLMMIGAGAAKLSWLQKAHLEKKKWSIILCISILLGVCLKSLPSLIDSNLAYHYIQQTLGGTILSFAYISLIILLTTNILTKKVLSPFASAGRMSLTIYLTQSIVGTLIFYSYGLGLYSKMTLGTSMLLAIIIFFIQVVVAEIWFSKFKYGPMEKVWRFFTYGKGV